MKIKGQSSINDIIPVSEEMCSDAKLQKKPLPSSMSSLTIDIDDCKIFDFFMSMILCFQITKIMVKKIFISFTFYHDDRVDKKYFGSVAKLEHLYQLRFIQSKLMTIGMNMCTISSPRQPINIFNRMLIDHQRRVSSHHYL